MTQIHKYIHKHLVRLMIATSLSTVLWNPGASGGKGLKHLATEIKTPAQCSSAFTALQILKEDRRLPDTFQWTLQDTKWAAGDFNPLEPPLAALKAKLILFLPTELEQAFIELYNFALESVEPAATTPASTASSSAVTSPAPLRPVPIPNSYSGPPCPSVVIVPPVPPRLPVSSMGSAQPVHNPAPNPVPHVIPSPSLNPWAGAGAYTTGVAVPVPSVPSPVAPPASRAVFQQHPASVVVGSTAANHSEASSSGAQPLAQAPVAATALVDEPRDEPRDPVEEFLNQPIERSLGCFDSVRFTRPGASSQLTLNGTRLGAPLVHPYHLQEAISVPLLLNFPAELLPPEVLRAIQETGQRPHRVQWVIQSLPWTENPLRFRPHYAFARAGELIDELGFGLANLNTFVNVKLIAPKNPVLQLAAQRNSTAPCKSERPYVPCDFTNGWVRAWIACHDKESISPANLEMDGLLPAGGAPCSSFWSVVHNTATARGYPLSASWDGSETYNAGTSGGHHIPLTFTEQLVVTLHWIVSYEIKAAISTHLARLREEERTAREALVFLTADESPKMNALLEELENALQGPQPAQRDA